MKAVAWAGMLSALGMLGALGVLAAPGGGAAQPAPGAAAPGSLTELPWSVTTRTLPVVAGAPPDRAEPPRALPFFYDLYTFRGERGGTRIVAAVAVQARRLRAERRDGEIRYRFDLRFVVADTASSEVFPSVDSVFVRSPQPLDRSHLLHTFVEIRAPPSDATIQRVTVTDATRPGVGQLYTTPYPVPDYRGTDLMLSDVALGLPDAESGWKRGDVTLALLPSSQFPESAFDVYYEVYNLPRGHPYDTEISIQPLDGQGMAGRRVSALFSDESRAGRDGTLRELRRVQSALERGRYLLTVTVRDHRTGATATSSRELAVRGWEAGTTLVRALPRGRGNG